MDFVEFCWRTTLEKNTAAAHYMWKIWLRCLESRIIFAEKTIYFLYGSENGCFKSGFNKYEYGSQPNMLRRREEEVEEISWPRQRAAENSDRTLKSFKGSVQ